MAADVDVEAVELDKKDWKDCTSGDGRRAIAA